MKKIKIFLLAAAVFMQFNLPAQKKNDTPSAEIGRFDEIYISANRFSREYSRIGSTVHIITADEIEKKGYSDLSSVLASIPGLTIKQNGTFGGTASAALRGGNARHTLIMIDGVNISDPSHVSQQAGIENISAWQIERIEIIKGNLSTLYGSDAIGGVINIITRRQADKKISVNARAEAGSFRTFREQLDLSGKLGFLSWFLSGVREDTAGISKALEKNSGQEFEKDPYHNTAASLRLELAPHERLHINSRTSWSGSRTDLDAGAFSDELHFSKLSENFLQSSEAEFTASGIYRVSGKYSFNKIFNNYLENTLQNKYSAKKHSAALQHDFTLKNHLFNLGSDFRYDSMASMSIDGTNIRNLGVFGQYSLNLKKVFSFTAGGRYDYYTGMDPVFTWRAETAFFIPAAGSKLHASYGTGFKTPSLFQLFHPLYGNKVLKPENSWSIDGGISQGIINNRLIVSAVYFYNYYQNLIKWENNGYKNVEKIFSRGVESGLEIFVLTRLSMKGSYTWSETRNYLTGKKLTMRPEHVFSGTISAGFYKNRGNIAFTMVYTWESLDYNYDYYPAREVTLDGYAKADMKISYKITPFLIPYIRAENIFNSKYSTSYGYASPGINFLGGLQVKI